MAKTVYVVTGSEDGILGVFGNVKRAYECAKQYVNEEDIEVSYSQACKELRDTERWGSVDLCDWDVPYSTIESHPFNEIR